MLLQSSLQYCGRHFGFSFWQPGGWQLPAAGSESNNWTVPRRILQFLLCEVINESEHHEADFELIYSQKELRLFYTRDAFTSFLVRSFLPFDTHW